MVLEHVDQTTLANACIPREQDHVPMTCFDLFPPFQEERDFRFATDQRCESSGLSHIQATLGTTLAQDAVDRDRLSNTSQCLCS